MRKTSVNIVEEKENSMDPSNPESFIPEEVSVVIDQLVELAVKHNVSRTDINDLLTTRRREYEYAMEVKDLPEESEKVKEFRVKLDAFFNLLEIEPKDVLQFVWDYEFWIANYHIEIPVAAYKLYLEGKEISDDNIFHYARAKMKPSDEYYKIRKIGYKGCWRVSKRMNIDRFRKYFNRLCNIRMDKFLLAKRFEQFVSDKRYTPEERTWLKLIYLVENYY